MDSRESSFSGSLYLMSTLSAVKPGLFAALVAGRNATSHPIKSHPGILSRNRGKSPWPGVQNRSTLSVPDGIQGLTGSFLSHRGYRGPL
ncbi:hypothetical protein OCA5_c13210 [Afipia carboxidovorans OM5]|uniref:Uncharacterized protein n=1 Tax=Afipia carboxidovorans (strain ATCC 49405 / DSM 1227 / KCTC 32145 / OM5) TaxID=504832 RepID=F8BWH0_AFIC5|nr:hypothetical protein OCA4_c13210 [Afipia carboxidovorans OM4]AEI06037.1 hypothetical protein OCA5_c13210 [Afipia carboxidovorans OM5]